MKRKTIGLLFVVLTIIIIFVVAVNAQIWDNPNGKVNFGHTHNWTTLASFPAACSAGQFVSGVGSVLTCATPLGGADNDWSGAGTGQMYATSLTDKIGIGTTSPLYKLTVDSSPNEIYMVMSEDGTDSVNNLKFQLAPGSGTSSTRIGYLLGSFGNGFFIGNPSNGPIHFVTQNAVSKKMTIVANGNVGIGTTSPTERLDVDGKVRVRALPLDNSLSDIVVADPDGVLHTRSASTLGGDNDWTITGNNMFSAVSGNVGIGGNNALAKLYVRSILGFPNGAIRVEHGSNGIGVFINPLPGATGPGLWANSGIRGDSVRVGTIAGDDVNFNPGSGNLIVANYTQLALTSGTPPVADCDEASEMGRMKVDDSGGGFLFVCTITVGGIGWVAK